MGTATTTTRPADAAEWQRSLIRQDEIDRYLDDGRDFIDEPAIEKALERGRALTDDELRARVRQAIGKAYSIKLMDDDERIPDEPTGRLAAPVRGRIEFDRVWFAYKGEDWVLRDLSFTVEPGETLAIVGYTGAGKSTVGSLLARLWDPQRGEIRLDGVPIRNLPLGELRSSIRPVMQDVFLFSGTVAGNIDLGLGLGPDEIRRAAEAVRADGFIERLDGGYDAKLGEGAATLSSGQRQLLSFARVVAHDPAIVVLDEATSSVDTETERLLQEGLAAMMRGRTTVAIAHRLSTIRHADRIVVLADGRLAEEGDHDSLIAKGGIYYTLYRLQYQGEASA